MYNRFTLLFLLALIVPTATTAQPVTNVEADEVDALFEAWDRPDAPGVALAVMHGGEVIYKQGYGMANLDYDIPITSATVFDIASVSKQFCAFSITLLAEEGVIDLDADVRNYLPEIPDFGKTITIRHLIHHTSGLRDWPGTLAMAGWSMEDVISFGQIMRMVRHQRDLNFEPGAEYSYSNTGYNVLAEVVARVTGQSFREWTDANLFKPLGMVHTHFQDDHEDLIKSRAYGYAPEGDGFRRLGNGLTALGSSSLFTTIDDLARWVQNFGDGRVGGSAVLEQVHQQGMLNSGEQIAYAFGHSVSMYRGLQRVAHSGSWAGSRTYLARFPDQDFAVIVLGNVSTFNAALKGLQVVDLYLGDQLAPEEPPSQPESSMATAEPFEPSLDELHSFEGTYYSGELETVYSLVVQEGKLIAQHLRNADITLSPTTTDTFSSTAWFIRALKLKRDGDRVTGFTLSNGRSRNVRFEKKH